MDTLARRRRSRLPRRRLQGAAVRPLLPRRHARSRARRAAYRQPARTPHHGRRRRDAARHSVGVRLDADPAAAPDLAGDGRGAARRHRERGEGEAIRELYTRWPFFRSTIDLIAMVLAKTERRIAAEYDRQLVPPELQPLGADLRQRLAETDQPPCSKSPAGAELLADNPVLRRSIDVRNPYVDPINLVQIELLRRLRARRRPGRTRDLERVHDHRQRDRRGDAEYGVGGVLDPGSGVRDP